jgi:hypothetical protein
MVSVAKIRLDRRKSTRLFKGIISRKCAALEDPVGGKTGLWGGTGAFEGSVMDPIVRTKQGHTEGLSEGGFSNPWVCPMPSRLSVNSVGGRLSPWLSGQE